MTLAKTLDRWLESRVDWLVEYGPTLLALDPFHEKLVPDSDRHFGLAIEVAGTDLIPVFGLPFRDDGVRGRSKLNTIKGELEAIVYDEPFEMVHAATDSLARYRASRHQGGIRWQTGFMRLPAVMRHFMTKAGNGETLSFDEARSIFSEYICGAMSWVDAVQGGNLRSSVGRDIPGLFYTCKGRTLTAHNLWLGCKQDALLNLCPFRGPKGWHYGSLIFDGTLPEAAAIAAIGRRLSSVVSYCLTDPFDLRILDVENLENQVMVTFSGAEQLGRHYTLFEDSAFDEPYGSEVAALERARQRLVANLTLALLPRKWWQQFRDASRKPGAPEICCEGSFMKNHRWVE